MNWNGMKYNGIEWNEMEWNRPRHVAESTPAAVIIHSHHPT